MAEESKDSKNLKLCECGCLELIPAINKLGKPARFKHGHNMKTPEARMRVSRTLRQPEEMRRRPREDLKREGAWNWKGNNVGYHGLHKWVRREKPRPLLCEICNSKPPVDVANIDGKYARDINDYQWLCRSCHRRKDKPRLGYHHSEETKRKISETNKKTKALRKRIIPLS